MQRDRLVRRAAQPQDGGDDGGDASILDWRGGGRRRVAQAGRQGRQRGAFDQLADGDGQAELALDPVADLDSNQGIEAKIVERHRRIDRAADAEAGGDDARQRGMPVRRDWLCARARRWRRGAGGPRVETSRNRAGGLPPKCETKRGHSTDGRAMSCGLGSRERPPEQRRTLCRRDAAEAELLGLLVEAQCGGRAGATPHAPVDAERRQTVDLAPLGDAVEEGGAEGVVHLARRADDARDRRAQDEVLHRLRPRRAIQRQRATQLAACDGADRLPGLLDDRRIGQQAGGMDDALHLVLAQESRNEVGIGGIAGMAMDRHRDACRRLRLLPADQHQRAGAAVREPRAIAWATPPRAPVTSQVPSTLSGAAPTPACMSRGTSRRPSAFQRTSDSDSPATISSMAATSLGGACRSCGCNAGISSCSVRTKPGRPSWPGRPSPTSTSRFAAAAVSFATAMSWPSNATCASSVAAAGGTTWTRAGRRAPLQCRCGAQQSPRPPCRQCRSPAPATGGSRPRATAADDPAASPGRRTATSPRSGRTRCRPSAAPRCSRPAAARHRAPAPRAHGPASGAGRAWHAGRWPPARRRSLARRCPARRARARCRGSAS